LFLLVVFAENVTYSYIYILVDRTCGGHLDSFWSDWDLYYNYKADM